MPHILCLSACSGPHLFGHCNDWLLAPLKHCITLEQPRSSPCHLQNLQAADSANFNEDARGRAAFSGSTGGHLPYSPRPDGLQHTPRPHIKSQEPASVPKVA